MECLYWLLKSEVPPHTSLYASMIEAVQFMGCDQLRHLHQGENVKYTSRIITHELCQVMNDHIECELKALLKSQYYSVMVDETIDISVIKEMVLYAQFVCDNSSVVTAFLKMIELSDGRAETVEEAILGYLMENSVPISGSIGFAVTVQQQ